MTLDPVHFDGIARLARRIEHDVDDADHREFAETVWNEFLDPLYHDGTPVLEPLGDLKKRRVDVEDVALRGDAFDTCHGLDSGTINPTTFKNGLVLDIAQAAMSSVPSTLDLHRSRTVIAAVHSNDATLRLDEEWDRFDEGFSRGKVIHAPSVGRYEKGVVHALSLYLAESEHALAHADEVADLLVLDGPLYPKGILNWLDQHPELAELLMERDVRQVVQNYVHLVERFVEREVPLVGFVKNMSTKAMTRALREKTMVGWANDAGFFSTVLERRELVDGEYERLTDSLSITNWFVSRAGSDRVFAADNDELDIERELDPEAYEVTFCVVYDPREDMIYKVEAPYAVTKDRTTRERIELQVLKDVAAERGPPLAVGKADELARISLVEKASLIRTLEETFDSDRDRSYDQLRWNEEY